MKDMFNRYWRDRARHGRERIDVVKGRPWIAIRPGQFRRLIGHRVKRVHPMSYKNPKVFTAWKRVIHSSRGMRKKGPRYLKK